MGIIRKGSCRYFDKNRASRYPWGRGKTIKQARSEQASSVSLVQWRTAAQRKVNQHLHEHV